MIPKHCIGQHGQRVTTGQIRRAERAQFIGSAGGKRHEVYAEHTGGFLSRTERNRRRRVLRIHQDADTCNCGKGLLEQAHPLGTQRFGADRHARDIAAGPTDARDEPQQDGVG
jgi:hypothetical protein